MMYPVAAAYFHMGSQRSADSNGYTMVRAVIKIARRVILQYGAQSGSAFVVATSAAAGRPESLLAESSGTGEGFTA